MDKGFGYDIVLDPVHFHLVDPFKEYPPADTDKFRLMKNI